MDNVAILLEHVNLLDGLDGLGVKLLQLLLELLVVGGRAGGRTLDLAAGGTLSTVLGLWLAAVIREGDSRASQSIDEHTLYLPVSITDGLARVRNLAEKFTYQFGLPS